MKFCNVVYCISFVLGAVLLAASEPNIDYQPFRLSVSASNAPANSLSTDLTYSRRVPYPQQSFIDAPSVVSSVHAGTITQTSDGTLLSAWFGGSREGGRDVKIYMATLKLGAESWSEPVVIASREQTVQDLNRYVTKLGNPILFCDSRDRIWLFYVTVSFGGWSGSSITYRCSDDGGESWAPARRLVTSPFLNISTLVKAAPLELQNGDILLPVYHEFVRKFGEAVVLSPDGTLVRKDRLTSEHGAIQPWIVPLNNHESVVLYRQKRLPHEQVLKQTFIRMGESYDQPAMELANVPNPDSALAAACRPNGELIMVCNPSNAGRNKLSLAISKDGINWRLIHDFENNPDGGEYSYPYLIVDKDDNYQLIYTWKRERMRHVAFSDEWVEKLR